MSQIDETAAPDGVHGGGAARRQQSELVLAAPHPEEVLDFLDGDGLPHEGTAFLVELPHPLLERLGHDAELRMLPPDLEVVAIPERLSDGQASFGIELEAGLVEHQADGAFVHQLTGAAAVVDELEIHTASKGEVQHDGTPVDGGGKNGVVDGAIHHLEKVVDPGPRGDLVELPAVADLHVAIGELKGLVHHRAPGRPRQAPRTALNSSTRSLAASRRA